jgi:hypothetical protein
MLQVIDNQQPAISNQPQSLCPYRFESASGDSCWIVLSPVDILPVADF